MGVYKNFQARHLPYGAWVCDDESVTVFSRLYARLFVFKPQKGVQCLGGDVDSLTPDNCVAEVLFRYDGTFNPNSSRYNPERGHRIERCMIEWSVAAEATRLDKAEVKRMCRPYLPASVRRYVSPHIEGRAAGVAWKIGGPASPTDKFEEYVVKRKQPPHPKKARLRN